MLEILSSNDEVEVGEFPPNIGSKQLKKKKHLNPLFTKSKTRITTTPTSTTTTTQKPRKALHQSKMVSFGSRGVNSIPNSNTTTTTTTPTSSPHTVSTTNQKWVNDTIRALFKSNTRDVSSQSSNLSKIEKTSSQNKKLKITTEQPSTSSTPTTTTTGSNSSPALRVSYASGYPNLLDDDSFDF